MLDDEQQRHPGGWSRRRLLRNAGLSLGAAAGLLGAGTLSGCGRGVLTRPAGPGWVTLNNDNSTWGPGYEAVSKVLRTRIGLGLQVRAIGNVSNYQQVVRMSAQTDSTTDLIKWWNGYRLQDLARGSVLAPVDAAWDAAERSGWVQDPVLRQRFSSAGKAYGVPLSKSYYVGFYSKRAFADIKADVPQSFDDLLGVARKLRDSGRTAIGAGGASSWESLIWFQQLLGTSDPDFYARLCNGQASYTDPTVRDAMALWASMYRDRLFSAPDADSSGFPVQLKSGELGMTLAATWSANSYAEAGVKSEDVGLFVLPAVSPQATSPVVVETGAVCVPSNAHKISQAQQVVGAWLAPDVQQAWVDFLGDTSANRSVVPRDSLVTSFARDVSQRRLTELTRYWEASPPVLVEGNVLDLSSWLTNPTVGQAQRTLSSMQRRAEQEWASWRQ